MTFLERILNKIGQEWEIFMTECNLMSKPGIISKSEEITEKRKIYQSLKHLCETEPECCRILVHMDFILEGAYRFVQDQKRPQETVEHTLKNWMDSMKNGTCSM